MDESISLSSILGPQSVTRLSVRRFSLMNALFSVLNSTGDDDPDNVIARYLLANFDHLDALNVYDMAEACYTSRSGIRRFCQAIGFDNFSGLKASAYEWQRHRDYFVGYVDHPDFRTHLADELATMMRTINDFVSEEDLKALATAMGAAHEVVLAASDFSSASLHDFQQSMLYMHKIVRIFTDSFGEEAHIDALGPADVVIMCSISGNYARVSQVLIERTRAQRVLVTVSHDEELAEPYDAVLYLAEDHLTRERSVYAKYGMSYFLDLLYHAYCDVAGALESSTLDAAAVSDRGARAMPLADASGASEAPHIA